MNWTRIAPGVWKAVIGEPEEPTPLALLGIEPAAEALQQLGNPALPLGPDAVTEQVVGLRTVVRLPLAPEEKLFGLGLQFFKVNQRGRTRYLRVNSDPRQDTGETHAPVPFYVSSRGYGILANTSRIVTVHCGSCVRKDAATAAPRDRNADREWSATPVSETVEIVVTAGGM